MLDITITDKAKIKILELLDNSYGALEISVVSGGCSGHTFNAVIVDEFKEEDVVCDRDGITVVADSRSSLFIEGLNIDYSNDLIQSGFRLTNENASQSCGCGSSFAM